MFEQLPRKQSASLPGFLARWLFITACLAALMLLWHTLSAKPSDANGQRTITPRGDLAGDEKATIAVFEASRGSVVSISTSQFVEDVWSRNILSVPRGTGSGFIWDASGHVVTNFHVIQGASAATIRLADGRKFRASLVGVSPEHDIAVLKIGVGFQAPNPIPLGTSADLKVGQKVLQSAIPSGWTGL
jgi:S1-C subfamily serine protease